MSISSNFTRPILQTITPWVTGALKRITPSSTGVLSSLGRIAASVFSSPPETKQQLVASPAQLCAVATSQPSATSAQNTPDDWRLRLGAIAAISGTAIAAMCLTNKNENALPPFTSPVIQIREDGNCLFHAFRYWLHLNDKQNPLPTSATLRREATSFLRNRIQNNDSETRRHIDQAVSGFNNKERRRLQRRDRDVYNAYIDLVSKPRFFAGAPEMYAFASMRRVRVNVYRQSEDSITTKFDPPIFPENFDHSTSLPVVSLYFVDDNHFNLISNLPAFSLWLPKSPSS